MASYPYRGFGEYRAWPGPNSNTFVAHVMRSVPALGAALPPTAIGKDWQPTSDIVGLTPSRTGIQLSLGGYAGITVGWVEGVELNFLGLIAGIDVRRPAVKLPGLGAHRIRADHLVTSPPRSPAIPPINARPLPMTGALTQIRLP